MGSEVQGEVAQGGLTQHHEQGLGVTHGVLQQAQDISSMDMEKFKEYLLQRCGQAQDVSSMNTEEFEEYLMQRLGCNSSSEWIREW